jgi:FtsP/CotA-like multicopper oxidase with cupredoxin domain
VRGLKRSDREVFGAGAWLFALLAILLAFGALVVAGSAMSTSEDAKAVAAVGGSGAKVTLSEFKIDPAMVDVASGGSIAVTNGGTVEHNLGVKGTDLKTENLKGGESGTLDLSSLKQGNYTIYCEIPGHEAAGMKASLMLGTMGGGPGGGTSAQEAALTAADKTNNAAMQKEMEEYVGQLTNGPLTEGAGNQRLAPTILPDGTKQFDLTAKIVDWQVDPQTTVRAWTYNGQVPGPLIQVSSGDRVRLVLKNELPQSTAIHFHGLDTPNAMDGVPYITQDPVLPGKTFTYEFVAKGPAVGMYHSHHYAVGQVSDGMAGAFLVDDPPVPAGYGPISQRVPMVLNDAGVIGFSLNGKSFPATAPIVMKAGETAAIDYLNEGQQIHPMHLHGVPQLVVAKDGFPLPQPYLADTVTVAPGERFTVLIKPTAAQQGVWAYHCHILSHAEHEDGMMFGMVTALVVQ